MVSIFAFKKRSLFLELPRLTGAFNVRPGFIVTVLCTASWGDRAVHLVVFHFLIIHFRICQLFAAL
jgi:hypothetical protein